MERSEWWERGMGEEGESKEWVGTVGWGADARRG